MSCQQLCKLCIEGYLAGLCGLYQRQFVYQVGEPLALFLPADVCTPECVLEWFVAHIHFGGEWLFVEEHYRSAQYQILAYLVVHVYAHHCLALHAVVVIAFHACVDVRSGIYQTLVDDGHASHAVVHGIVGILRQSHSSSGHDYRPLSYVGDTKVNFCGIIALVATCKQEFVVLGYLLGHRLGAVIEFFEAIFVGQGIVFDPCPEVLSEGFCDGEDDAPLLYRVSFHEVELSVGIGIPL